MERWSDAVLGRPAAAAALCRRSKHKPTKDEQRDTATFSGGEEYRISPVEKYCASDIARVARARTSRAVSGAAATTADSEAASAALVLVSNCSPADCMMLSTCNLGRTCFALFF